MIADTHGLVRAEAEQALAGCDLLIHAGDVGKPEVLDKLRRIAPLRTIRGNVDKWASDLPETDVVEIGEHLIYVLHNVDELKIDPAGAGFAAVISGHSHRPRIERREGVLYLNPGSAGPRRFKLPVTVALLDVLPMGLQAKIVELTV
ncbi:MAG TPA: metallophosphoesterase family protein [Gammaproteobacteria bacterium]|nr:metallophosphoesterase family protein [Gammaproteobacteria bacterium]